jgi:hypothetical protein
VRRRAFAVRLTPAQAAWIGALPCTAVVALAVAALARPLGALLFPPQHVAFLSTTQPVVRPEPTEHARYLIALAAPLLLAWAIAARSRWQQLVPADVAVRGVQVTQAMLLVVVLACLVRQYELRFGFPYTEGEVGGVITLRYFTPPTLAAAAAFATAVLLTAWRVDVRGIARALGRETRALRVVVLLAAIAITVIWLLPSVYTDRSIGAAQNDVFYHVGFTLDETFAVLNGRTPLVDFTAQYASLWPYVGALTLLALGKTLLAFTATMVALSALSLVAIYLVLRRVARSSVAALLLYLPFLATSVFLLGGSSQNRSSVGNYFANFPLRYAGPYLLAWLTARQLERRGHAGQLLLLTVAGLVLLNNADFGLPALAGTIAALVWTLPVPRRPPLARLAASAASGLAIALALVSLLTLVRAGSLPQFSRLVAFSRLYTLGGYAMMPIPGVLGVHLLIYLTYVAAIAVATVEATRQAPNRALAGMLVWSGVFGLGSAGYYVGRSHPVALTMTFSAWALALVLLTAVALRGLVRERTPRPTLAAFAVLFGFGVAACSLAQVPLPWSQLQRLNAPFVPTETVPFASPLVPPQAAATRDFVRSLADGRSHFVVRRGAPVAILLTTGHRIADAYGVVNVSPYTGTESLHTVEAVDTVVAALRRAGGNTIILPRRLEPSILQRLQQVGFRVVTDHGLGVVNFAGRTSRDILLTPWKGDDAILGNPGSLTKWVDTRHLYPRALHGASGPGG